MGGQDHRPSGEPLPRWGLSLLHFQVFCSRLGFYRSVRGPWARLTGAELALNFQSFQRMGRLSRIRGRGDSVAHGMNSSLLGSSVHGIFQARILEWGAISFSRGSSVPRDQTQVSYIAGRRFTV